MTIIQPERAADWGKVLVQGYKEGGILPKWPLASSYTGCMVGYPAVSVLADLVTKDLAEGDLNVWAEAGARSSVYRNDLAEKFFPYTVQSPLFFPYEERLYRRECLSMEFLCTS